MTHFDAENAAGAGRSPGDGNEDIYQYIGRQLRNLRIGRGMTQAQAAEVIGVSPQQYQKYEDAHSKCSLNNLLILANFFGVSLTAVLPEQAHRGTAVNEADLLARLVAAYTGLADLKEKMRIVQLLEAIRDAHQNSE